MLRTSSTTFFLALALAACSDVQQSPTLASTGAKRSSSANDNLLNGAVYTETDELANRVVAYYRDQDGTLQPAGSFPTGGNGSGAGSIFGQGAVVLSGHEPGARVATGANQLLFVANAGSNEISVFRVEPQALVLVDKVASGGLKPISITVYQDVMYVLHQTSGTITGFHLSSKGQLTPIPGSTRALAGGPGSNPAQVEFSKDGETIAVTEREPAVIDTYHFDKRTGLTTEQFATPASGLEPFGFAFDNRNHLVSTDGFGVVPAQGGASTYDVLKSSQLMPISSDRKNGGTDTCWLVITDDGRFVYVQSFGDSRLSSYRLEPSGQLTLLESAAGFSGVGPGGFDIGLDNGSHYLYALNQQGTISAFTITSAGALVPLQTVNGLPPSVTGMAVR